MRDIKFRVWDYENKEMLYQGSNSTELNSEMDCAIDFDDFGIGVFIRNYGEQNWETVSKFELLQYTGIKDKNGKEIYEGDIVRAWDGYREYICEVVWLDGAWFGMKYRDKKGEIGYIPLGAFEKEVIGNIYETKMPKQKTCKIELGQDKHIAFFGCVCEFADECDMTLKEFLDGKKCKASYSYLQK